MSNGKFLLSACAAEWTKHFRLGPRAQKLFLALVYEQNRECGGWSTGPDWMETACQSYHRPLHRFRVLGCAPKAGNARFFRQAVEELEQMPDLFEHITLDAAKSTLTWAFGLQLHGMMAEMQSYALMSIADISQFTNLLDLPLLAQITLNQKKRLPEFVMFQDNCGFETGAGSSHSSSIDLRQARRQLEPALAKWACHIGYSFIVGYEQPSGRPVYHQARIRFRSPTSSWKDTAFQRFAPNTKIVRIGG